MTTVIEHIGELLEDAGAGAVFGFPGETSLPIYRELQRRNSTLRHVLARSPRGAGYMADGYARVSGRVGICDVPGGIGSPFIVPAAHEANNSSVPMVILASGPKRSLRDAWTTSTCDQQGLFRAVTRRTFYLEDATSVNDVIYEAFRTAAETEIGPVFVEIPSDLFTEKLPSSLAKPNSALPVRYPAARPAPKPELLHQAARLLSNALSPCILAGGGVHLSSAVSTLSRFALGNNLRVATTLNGKGAFPETHPLALGVAGAKGHFATNDAMREADCVLVLGSKLGDKTCNYGDMMSGRQTVVHVDLKAGRGPARGPNYVPVRADVRAFLEALTPLVSRFERSWRPIETPPFWTEGPTHALCEQLSALLPEQSILVADASVSRGWAGGAVRFSGERQRLLTPAGSGSLSYALPAALGAKIAAPESNVVAIGGDGGFSMAMHDLETAVRYRLPILYVLLNNQSLGLIDKHMQHFLDGEPVSRDFHDIDWRRVVEAHGWRYLKAADASSLEEAMGNAAPFNAPTLLELRVPREEIAPDFAITLATMKASGVRA